MIRQNSVLLLELLNLLISASTLCFILSTLSYQNSFYIHIPSCRRGFKRQ